jgi:hypothetical protein
MIISQQSDFKTLKRTTLLRGTQPMNSMQTLWANKMNN